jgi:NCAIR mutase (PurE)-related protein
MDRQEMESLLERLEAGKIGREDFVSALTAPRSAHLGDATVDLDRTRRCGFPEVVYGEGKSIEALERIVRRLAAEGVAVLATRVSVEQARLLRIEFPEGRYNETARTFRLAARHERAEAPSEKKTGRVAVVTAGTSDLPVAEEARETLDWMGVQVTMIHDVGVAGPHRLLEHLDKLRAVDVVVVVAGLEGALPSVVGGYVDCPVIAVPSSIGYGASFGGVAALLGMLNSCSSSVAVVNIDAGFKGGYVAGLIARGKSK